MIATCQKCRNTGTFNDGLGNARYCDCPAALAVRARVESDTRLQELRAKIDRMLDEPPLLVIADPKAKP